VSEKLLDFASLAGELRELAGRVVALELRDADKNLLVSAEGPFGHFESESDSCSFELAGDPPPEREGPRFIVASWVRIEIAAERVSEVRDTATGIGPTVNLQITLADGTTITLWPAMPPREQWTDLHDQNR
jgi:hypothetical protein